MSSEMYDSEAFVEELLDEKFIVDKNNGKEITVYTRDNREQSGTLRAICQRHGFYIAYVNSCSAKYLSLRLRCEPITWRDEVDNER